MTIKTQRDALHPTISPQSSERTGLRVHVTTPRNGSADALGRGPGRVENGPGAFGARAATAKDWREALGFAGALSVRVSSPVVKSFTFGEHVQTREEALPLALSFAQLEGKPRVTYAGVHAPLDQSGAFNVVANGITVAGRLSGDSVVIERWESKREKLPNARVDLGDLTSGAGQNWRAFGFVLKRAASGALEVNDPSTGKRQPVGQYFRFDEAAAAHLQAALPAGAISASFKQSLQARVTSESGGMSMIDEHAELTGTVSGEKQKGLSIVVESSHGGKASGSIRQDGRFFVRSPELTVVGQLGRDGKLSFSHYQESWREPSYIPAFVSSSAGLEQGPGSDLGLIEAFSFVGIRSAGWPVRQ